jgi:hypothetical protein
LGESLSLQPTHGLGRLGLFLVTVPPDREPSPEDAHQTLIGRPDVGLLVTRIHALDISGVWLRIENI